MIVRSGVAVSCPLMFGERKRPYLTIRSYDSPNWASPSYCLLSCDIMQHCVIRRVRPTNSKLTVGLRSKQWSVELMSLSVRARPYSWKRKRPYLTIRSYGSPNWARTSDIMINSHALYRLSYRGMLYLFSFGLENKPPFVLRGWAAGTFSNIHRKPNKG